MSASDLGTPLNALRAAVIHFGSQAALARAVGIKQPSIAGALLRGKVSPALAIKIHNVSGGAIPKWKLRPDLWGLDLKQARETRREARLRSESASGDYARARERNKRRTAAAGQAVSA
jgi:DNA-binding transcriptional regulator YdaS (Cro superfamily)